MTLGIGPLPPFQPPAAPSARPAPPSGGFTLDFARAPDTVELSVPATPPAAVRDEVAAAAERAAELAAANRELHFAKDEETGRVIVQVRDMEGHVIRTIPPSDAFAVLAGGSL